MTGRREALLETLKRAAVGLKRSGVPFALAGGCAVYARGGPGSEHDVDFAVRPEDAAQAADALEAVGFEIRHPPEDWLIKAYDEDRFVDLIFRIAGRPVTSELLDRAELLYVESVEMPVLPATDLLVGLLLALSDHNCNFAKPLAAARIMREQVDWPRLRAQVERHPFAYAFLVLLERLGVLSPGEDTDDTSGAVAAGGRR
jgi:hypothetical protein